MLILLSLQVEAVEATFLVATFLILAEEALTVF
jgi:hypothetical protein